MSSHTSLKGAVALVTGANRGIGAAFVSGLLEAGAGRVYAAARDPQTLAALVQSNARVVPIALDITDDMSVQAAAARLIDVDLVVNNAGVLLGTRLIAAADLAAPRQEMEVNYFGLLRMCRAFAPILAAKWRRHADQCAFDSVADGQPGRRRVLRLESGRTLSDAGGACRAPGAGHTRDRRAAGLC